METIFRLSNLLVIPFWGLIILLPHWHWTKRILKSVWVCVPIALLYMILIVPMMPSAFGELMNPSLPAIVELLGTPEGATIGWVHFLAFDLFVGRWVYLDSRTCKISAWLASPVLFLTLLFGPFGFMLYLGLRPLTSKSQDKFV